ncbi:SDR family oxidoreductase [Streptomyces capitiformicae]|uniref:Ketoreductase n=1 Tax=Streptomyces capitiformicae TaxID=2014920 RepID=A0A919DIP9_9ACTN|nr:SDR family oxidoreductase [Streptomyces capitiformicae]GHE48326.1 ketoreductase [Streptomyces capitiformicae]
MVTLRKTILLTGGSGVLGTALIPQLGHHRIIALAHRRPPSGCDEVVHGNVSLPLLGLDAAVYRKLCAEVDVVIHSAGMVKFSSTAEEMETLNVRGAREMSRFAVDADAALIHVSTAYVARVEEIRAAGGEQASRAGSSPSLYVTSKVLGEQIVRESGAQAVIVRPSIIIGDSVTGEISQKQGLHTFAHNVLRNRLPFVPSDPTGFVDFVPQDLVARAIVTLLDRDVRDGEYWISSGSHALTSYRLTEVIVEEADARGITVNPLRVLAPDIVERLVRPAFFDVVPGWAKTRLDGLLDMSAVLFHKHPIPSSLAEIPGCEYAADVKAGEKAWRASVRRMIQERYRTYATA